MSFCRPFVEGFFHLALSLVTLLDINPVLYGLQKLRFEPCKDIPLCSPIHKVVFLVAITSTSHVFLLVALILQGFLSGIA